MRFHKKSPQQSLGAGVQMNYLLFLSVYRGRFGNPYRVSDFYPQAEFISAEENWAFHRLRHGTHQFILLF